MKRAKDFDHIWIHARPVDGRLQINGLASLANQIQPLHSTNRSLYLFTNKRKRVIKALYWAGTGFCLWMMRLEKDAFRWPKPGDRAMTISPQQFEWLIDGIDLTKITSHEEVTFSSYT